MEDKYKVFDDKVVLVTGGTGSFGRAFVRKILNNSQLRKLIIFSRDEQKQNEMSLDFRNHPAFEKMRFFIGDVRDKARLEIALTEVDIVVHAAALKIVPIIEYNPFECIKTNILGAMNLMEALLRSNVSKVVALSTDKASEPVNLYGATKLCSDKIFTSGGVYFSSTYPRINVVRYGNVVGSRGSVVPFFINHRKNGWIPITDSKMTRFSITMSEAIELVVDALNSNCSSQIFVKKIPSFKITELAKVLAPDCEHRIVGVRPGEKIHEQMISNSEARLTYEFENHYRIKSEVENSDLIGEGGRLVDESFLYSSDNNQYWLNGSELKSYLLKEGFE